MENTVFGFCEVRIYSCAWLSETKQITERFPPSTNQRLLLWTSVPHCPRTQTNLKIMQTDTSLHINTLTNHLINPPVSNSPLQQSPLCQLTLPRTDPSLKLTTLPPPTHPSRVINTALHKSLIIYRRSL